MTDYSESQLERLVVAEERRAAALESLASQLPSLIENLGKRGGGGWSGGKAKEGDFHGIFKATPDLSSFKANDSYQVPVSGYFYDTQWCRVKFMSPFTGAGVLSSTGVGMTVASADPAKDNWTKTLKLGDWKYDTSGAAKTFPLRIAHMRVGVDKENPDKKFSFLTKLEDTGNYDAESYEYVTQQAPAAPAAKTQESPTVEQPF